MAGDGTNNVADLMVIFGITGDLAQKMTFRALYRLERIVQPLLDHPPDVQPYPRGSWGPPGAQPFCGHHRWQQPWLATSPGADR